MIRIEVVKGDITEITVDAIVNAANSSLLGGGGVDGAIHRAAGKELLEECRKLGGCKTGEAKITKAYNLPTQYVIHTVGPVWNGGKNNEAILLKSCYVNSLKLATQNQVKTIAFPAISTGVYRYPLREATTIAFESCAEYLKNNLVPERIIFVCFNDELMELYQEVLKGDSSE